MRRRQFISLLGGVAACPLAARAQVSSGKRPLIAWLSGGTTAVAGRFAADFVDGMRELGYVEGQNFDMVYRYAEGFQDRLPALAQELVQLKPEVIVAAAINVAVPVRHATRTNPIVRPALDDAV